MKDIMIKINIAIELTHQYYGWTRKIKHTETLMHAEMKRIVFNQSNKILKGCPIRQHSPQQDRCYTIARRQIKLLKEP